MTGIQANKFRSGVLTGIAATLIMVALMGAVRNENSSSPPPLPVAVFDSGVGKDSVALAASGRYQIVTWGSGGAYGVFVVDTSTGTTKAVYSSSKGADGKAVNNLGKPFAQIP